MKKITKRSTKEEVLAAYEALVHEKGTAPADVPTEDMNDGKEENITSSKKSVVGTKTTDTAAHDLIAAMREMSERMNRLFDVFVDAVESEARRVHDEEDAFEALLAKRRAEREREEEEKAYTYSIEHKRKTDELARSLEEKKHNFEQSIEERERAIKAREAVVKDAESELADVRKRVENAPKDLEKAVEAATAEARRAAQQEAKVTADLIKKDADREREVARLRIEQLEAALKKADDLTRSFEQAAADAHKKMQELATTVIEGQRPVIVPPARQDIVQK
ncbi:hypothetical protein FJY93_01880 [Candidatus Kaiserbacteria bacterium]|nr:hypothetical protein [Candidatus Kaiserbacteria bacterium]